MCVFSTYTRYCNTFLEYQVQENDLLRPQKVRNLLFFRGLRVCRARQQLQILAIDNFYPPARRANQAFGLELLELARHDFSCRPDFGCKDLVRDFRQGFVVAFQQMLRKALINRFERNVFHSRNDRTQAPGKALEDELPKLLRIEQGLAELTVRDHQGRDVLLDDRLGRILLLAYDAGRRQCAGTTGLHAVKNDFATTFRRQLDAYAPRQHEDKVLAGVPFVKCDCAGRDIDGLRSGN